MVKQYKKITSLLLTSMLFVNSISSSITYAFDFPNIFGGNEYKIETKDIKNKYNGKKLDKIKKSVKGKNYYTVLIESNDSLDKTNDFFVKGDKGTKLKKVGNNKYLVKIPVNSEKLGADLGKIDNGVLPTKIGNYSVIEPEIVNIQTEGEGEGNNYLTGEELDKLWYTKKVGADTFQEELKTKQKIKVGVLDTGIDYNHNDLKDNYNIQLSYNFISDSNDSMDDNGHGTQVTGVLGASVNGSGIFGVDSNIDLVSLKVLDKDGLGTTYDILDAISYAKDNGIKVLNMSFGGSGDPQTSSVCQAITEAKQNGVITVVPAGNANTSIANTIPAACSDAITVGSTDKENKKADFSSFGDGVDVYAPGVDIYTTNLDNTYISQNGTSLSTPIVTGLIARELAVDNNIGYEQIVNNLFSKYNLLKNSDLSIGTDNNGDTSSGQTQTGSTGSGSTGTGAIEIKPIDYSKYKYYEGLFKVDGKTYGNSLYEDNMGFVNLKLDNVKIYTYDEYQKLQQTKQGTFKSMSIPTNGLAGSWDLNGNANDTSGNGNHGIPYNMSRISSGKGDNKQVGSFNGTNSYISYSNPPNLNNPVTFSFSYKTSANYLNASGVMLGKFDNGVTNGNNYWIGLNPDNKLTFFVGSANGYTQVVDSITTNDGYYHNVIGLFDGSNIKLYRDGELIGTTSTSSCYPGGNLSLGKFGDYNGFYFNGQISDFLVYNRTVSDSEIQQINQDGLSLNDGLVGKWNLNGDANDTSGNGNNLTAHNVTWKTNQVQYASLNGESSYIDGNITTQQTNTQFSMSVWLKRTGNGSGPNNSIIQAQKGNSIAVFALWIDGNNQIGGFNSAGALTYTSVMPQLNIWEHYVITRNLTNTKIFRNGEIITSQPVGSNDINGPIDYIRIGSRENIAEFFKGDIGKTKIYNHELSQIEIQQLYQEGLSLNDGLIGRWDLHGNANDTSGNENNGIPYNINWSDNNTSASTSTDDTYINIPNSPSLNISGNHTVCGWFYPRKFGFNSTSKESLLVSKGTRPTYNYRLDSMYPNSGNELFGGFNYVIYDGSPRAIWTSRQDYPNNHWYLVCGLLNGTTSKLYVNGNLQGTLDNVGQPIINNNDVYIGKFGFGPNYAFDGKSKQIKIYNRALSDSEIQKLYQEGLGGNTNTSNTTLDIKFYGTDNYGNFGNNSVIRNSNNNLTNGFQNGQYGMSIDNKAPKNQTSNEGDPVTLSNGEFTYSNTLMSIPGNKIPFNFDLTYRNQITYNGPVGNKFDYSYNMFLTEQEDGSVNFYNGKLGLFNFALNGTSYVYSSGLKANLTKDGNGLYQVVFDNGNKYYFGTNLKVSKIEDKYGNNLQFTYNDNKQLTQVTDTLGRNITLSYYDSTRLYRVTDFNGRYIELVYYNGEAGGSVGDLKSAKIVNGESNKTISFEYDSNSNIYKMYDSKGQLYVTNIYNADNRVTSQTYGNGTITYAYTLAADGTVETNTVTNRSGVTTVYTYDSFGNTLKREIKDKVGYSATVYDYYYDTNHRLVKEKLPRGNGIYYTYDSRGNIIEKREMLDAELSSTEDLVTAYEYNQTYDIPTKVTLPNGLVKNYTLDANGNITKEETSDISSNDGVSYKVTTNYEYNNLGQLTKKTDPEGNITRYEYNNGHLVKSIKGPDENKIEEIFTYNNYGNILTSTDGEGKITTFEYNEFNLLSKSTSPTGIVTKYYYDANNNKVKEEKILVDGTPITTTYEYDTLDHLVKQTTQIDAENNRVTTMTYDNDENLLSTQEGDGAIIKNAYNEIGKVIQKRIITDTNNPDSDIVTTYTYDRNGNVIQEVDPNWNVTSYFYDYHDRLIRKTYPNSTYETFVYNKLGKVTEHTNNSSTTTIVAKTTYIYDELGNVLQTINHKLEDDSQVITKAKYNKSGQVVVTSDPAGNLSYITYDNFGRQTESTDSLGNKTTSIYNKNSQVIEKKIIGNNNKETHTTYSYNDDGKVLSETNSDNKTKSYTYNNLGQVTSITDEKGNTTYYNYNYVSNLLSEKKVLKNSDNTTTDILTSYTYDTHGNVLSLNDSNGNVTRYTYDKIGRKISETYPDNTVYTFNYDKNSNLVSTTDANGTIVTNTYDNLSRISERNIQTGTGVIGVTKENYSYDTLGRLYGSAQELNNTGGLVNVLEFNYNSLSQLVKEKNSGVDVNYIYDINGNRTNINIDGVSSGSGYTVSYAYDVLNRLNSVNYNGKNISSYSYTGVLLDKVVNGNNTETNRSYDSLFRLKTLETISNVYIQNPATIKSYNYTYDDVSNITNDGTKSYTYDSLYRLIDSSYTEPTKFNGIKDNEVYNYDKMGNRITTSDNINGTQSYSGNILNQYTSRVSSGTGGINTGYVYDNNGNLKEDSKQKYSYDYKNRLVEVKSLKVESGKTEGEIIASFSYDTLGRRIQKITSSENIKYLYVGEQLIQEQETNLTNQTTKVKSYINGEGVDEVLAYEYDDVVLPDNLQGEYNFCVNRINSFTGEFIQYGYSGVVNRCNELQNQSLVTSKKLYYIHTNNLGSITDITNESGSVILSYEYDNFGGVYVKTGSGTFVSINSYNGNTHGNTRLFTGREYDKEIGLYYYRARYYSADLGRFVSRDPVGTNDQINLYTYVGSNPVMYSDPSGKYAILVAYLGEATSGIVVFITWMNTSGNTQRLIGTVSSLIALDSLNKKLDSGFDDKNDIIGLTNPNDIPNYEDLVGLNYNDLSGPIDVYSGVGTTAEFNNKDLVGMDNSGLLNDLLIGNNSLDNISEKKCSKGSFLQSTTNTGNPKDAQKKVEKGQGPKDIKRIDKPEDSVPGSQWHAHDNKKGAGYNQDGTIHDGHKGTPQFGNKTLDWLNNNGWNIKK